MVKVHWFLTRSGVTGINFPYESYMKTPLVIHSTPSLGLALHGPSEVPIILTLFILGTSNYFVLNIKEIQVTTSISQTQLLHIEHVCPHDAPFHL